MKLPLIYKASSAGNFSIIPFNIEFVVGTLSTSFRLSIPQDTQPGIYEIQW